MQLTIRQQTTYTIILGFVLVCVGLGYLPLGIDHFEYPKFLALFIGGSALLFCGIFWSGEFVWCTFPRPVLISLGVYFFGQLAAYWFSIDRELSLLGAPFRYQGLVASGLYIIILFAATHLFYSINDMQARRFFAGLAWLGGLASAIALTSYTGLFFSPALFDNRVYGTFGNPNYLAGFLLVCLPCVTLVRNRAISFALGLIMIATLFVTGSRSAWLALFFSATLYQFLFSKFNQRKIILTVGFIATSAAIIFFSLDRLNIAPINRIHFTGTARQSIVTRAALWPAGIKIIAERPLSGFGQDTLRQILPPFLPTGVTFPESPTYFDRVHSEPLDIWATGGIFSLVGYLALFVSALYFVYLKQTATTLTALDKISVFGLVALFIFHLVNFSTITTNVLWYIFIAFALAGFIKKWDTI